MYIPKKKNIFSLSLLLAISTIHPAANSGYIGRSTFDGQYKVIRQNPEGQLESSESFAKYEEAQKNSSASCSLPELEAIRKKVTAQIPYVEVAIQNAITEYRNTNPDAIVGELSIETKTKDSIKDKLATKLGRTPIQFFMNDILRCQVPLKHGAHSVPLITCIAKHLINKNLMDCPDTINPNDKVALASYLQEKKWVRPFNAASSNCNLPLSCFDEDPDVKVIPFNLLEVHAWALSSLEATGHPKIHGDGHTTGIYKNSSLQGDAKAACNNYAWGTLDDLQETLGSEKFHAQLRPNMTRVDIEGLAIEMLEKAFATKEGEEFSTWKDKYSAQQEAVRKAGHEDKIIDLISLLQEKDYFKVSGE